MVKFYSLILFTCICVAANAQLDGEQIQTHVLKEVVIEGKQSKKEIRRQKREQRKSLVKPNGHIKIPKKLNEKEEKPKRRKKKALADAR